MIKYLKNRKSDLPRKPDDVYIGKYIFKDNY
jgi:hypothetical protein